MSLGSVIVLLCGLVATCVASTGHAASGTAKGTVLDDTNDAPVTQGIVSLTINGVPWGSTAPIDGAGNFDFGTVVWSFGSSVTCQFETSGTGYIDGGTSTTLASGGSTLAVIRLKPGSSIAGTVTDLQNQPIPIGMVRIFDSGGALLGSASANAAGAYRYGGLLAGTYYAETDFPDYLDQLWSGFACTLDECPVTSGTPIALPDQTTNVIANFQLAKDLIFRATFD